jgi:hypothetical protein
VYDAESDPVYVEALGALLGGGKQAVEEIHADGVVFEREPAVKVSVFGQKLKRGVKRMPRAAGISSRLSACLLSM